MCQYDILIIYKNTIIVNNMNNEASKEIVMDGFSWSVPEMDQYSRTKEWYIFASISFALSILYCAITLNYLFAIILILSAFIIIAHDKGNVQEIHFEINHDGVIIGKKFYDFDELKDFSIVYKPSLGIKRLYFEYKNSLKQRLSIPLFDNNPLLIRKFLLKYMQEDLDRVHPPLSEQLRDWLKL